MSVRAPERIRDFASRSDGVEAVLQHVGLRTWDLVLIDPTGLWIREETSSKEEAEAICASLGIRLNRGWDDPRLGRLMAARDHWGAPGGQRRAL